MQLLTVEEMSSLVKKIPSSTPKDTAVIIEANDQRACIKDFKGKVLSWDRRIRYPETKRSDNNQI